MAGLAVRQPGFRALRCCGPSG